MGRKDKEIYEEDRRAWKVGRRMRAARQATNISLTEMANRVGYTKNYLSAVENNHANPSPELIATYEQELKLAPGELSEDLPERTQEASSISEHSPKFVEEEWGDAPDHYTFYGREEELTALQRWVAEDGCQLLVIMGIGGIGKTTLAMELAKRVQFHFQQAFWFSLTSFPTLNDLLKSLLGRFHKQDDFPSTTEKCIEILLKYFQDNRCLLILDNFESVLQENERVGKYQDENKGYKNLLNLLGEKKHQSCVILTSREKPQEIAFMEDNSGPVRSFRLSGIGEEEGRSILKERGLSPSDAECRKLVEIYSGNPLALKLVSEYIREVFHSSIAIFLKEEVLVFGGIRRLIEKQFQRLSPIEKQITYWLAIYREPMTFEDIKDYLLSYFSISDFLSLRQRSFIESDDRQRGFSLQPVILEFVTNTFVNSIFEEICQEQFVLFKSYALLIAQTKDYVRETQVRFIVQPLIERLLMQYQRPGLESKLKKLVANLHPQQHDQDNYLAGNLLNLLLQLHINVRGYDFSHLVVRQAYLQDKELPEVNFAEADFRDSVFTQTFGSIFSISLSPTQHVLAMGTANSEIRTWRIDDGTPLLTYHGHADWVRSIAFSPDGNLLASGSEDKTVRLWNTETGECLQVLQKHTNRVSAVAFSPYDDLLASGSDDKTICLWEVKTRTCVAVLQGHESWIYSVCFSPDGKWLASSSEDKTVRIWNVATGNLEYVLQGHQQRVYCLAFSYDGLLLASGSADQTVRLWNTETRAYMHVLPCTGGVRCLAFDQTSNFLAAGNDAKTIQIWNKQTNWSERFFRGHANWVRSAVFNQDSQTLVTGSDDQTVRFWEMNTGKCFRIMRGHTYWVYAVAFNPQGTLLASGGDDKTVCLWDVKTEHCERIIHETGKVRCVAFSPSGEILACGGDNQVIRLWNVQTGRAMQLFEGHEDWVRSLAFSPDGQTLVSSSEDKTIRLWDVKTGRCLQILSDHEDWVYCVVFNHLGTLLASASADQTVRLWDARTGRCLKVLSGHDHKVCSVAFSPNDQLLASSSADRTIRLWDIHSGSPLHTLEGHTDWIFSLAFSSDGRLLASGSDDKTIRVWDVETGKVTKKLTGHTSWVYSVVISQDGKILASGSDDGTARLWNLQTGDCLSILRRDRPYEKMNIIHAKGLKPPQVDAITALGGISS